MEAERQRAAEDVPSLLIAAGQTTDQKQVWAVPILRAEMAVSLGMSKPGAGSDLASPAHPGGAPLLCDACQF
jgi:alkylation response protein AidB-like acyl-CoA dehydrogenase